VPPSTDHKRKPLRVEVDCLEYAVRRLGPTGHGLNANYEATRCAFDLSQL